MLATGNSRHQCVCLVSGIVNCVLDLTEGFLNHLVRGSQDRSYITSFTFCSGYRPVVITFWLLSRTLLHVSTMGAHLRKCFLNLIGSVVLGLSLFVHL